MKRLFRLLVLGLLTFGSPVFAQDAIDLHAAHIHGSPADVADWVVTARLDSLTFDPQGGLSFARVGGDWPAYFPFSTPPRVGTVAENGVDGAIQYTVWACAQVDGWTCAGFIQMWRDRPSTGAPLPSEWTYWWGPGGSVTSGRFGAYVPKPGDTMAFFLTAGNARGETNATSVRERSNVVTVVLPAGDAGVFSFDAAPPPPPVPPSTIPGAPPSVIWTQDVDLDALMARLAALEGRVMALEQARNTNEQIVAALTANFGNRLAALEAKPIPMSCSASVFGIPVHCALGQ